MSRSFLYRIALAVLLGPAWIGRVGAQPAVVRQSLYWTRYYQRWEIGPHASLHWEADNRQFFLPAGGHHQFISHLHFHHTWKQLAEGWLGLSFSKVGSQKPGAGLQGGSPEIRPWQALSLQRNIARGILSHRLRWEERFIRRAADAGTPADFRFLFRLRYAGTFQLPLGPRASLKVGDEVMVQWERGNSRWFDQNRLWVGGDFSWAHKRWNIELLCMWLWQKSTANDVFFDRDVVRITLGNRISRRLRGEAAGKT